MLFFNQRTPRPRLSLRLPLLASRLSANATDRYLLASALASTALASPGLATESSAPLLNGPCGGRKKALLIGITYPPRAGRLQSDMRQLKYPHKDINALRKMLQERDFSCKVMLDKFDYPEILKPRRTNITRELIKLVQGAKRGDKLVVCFSGHGKQLPTRGAEEEDGQDEYLVPLDWELCGLIRDNLLNALLVAPLPPGVKLLVIVDACHSGTILDLRHNWDMREGEIYGPHTYPPRSPTENFMERLGFSMQQAPGSHVLCLSAARDATLAYEHKNISYIRFFIEAYAENSAITIRELFNSIENRLRNSLRGLVQQPQISSNDPYLNLDRRITDFL